MLEGEQKALSRGRCIRARGHWENRGRRFGEEQPASGGKEAAFNKPPSERLSLSLLDSFFSFNQHLRSKGSRYLTVGKYGDNTRTLF